MFLRQARAGFHTYLRLVENYRQGDRVRQRIVLHLGRKDLLAPHLDSLVRVLQADDPAPWWVAAGQLSTPQAWTWGPVLAARLLFNELGLGAVLDGPGPPLRHGQPFVGARLPSDRLSSDTSRQRACLGRVVGGLLRLQRRREPLAAAVESVAAGEGQLRAVEVVASNSRRPSAGERAHRKRPLLPPPRSVQSATGLGLLRPDLHLL